MKYLISKPLRNTLSSLKNRILGRASSTNENQNFNKYYTLQRDNKLWEGVPTRDDFNWSIYNLHYRGEVEQTAKEYTLTLKENDYIFSDNKLIWNNKNMLPLHPNAQLLYETILQLNPKSVFEMGCGNGVHLYNLQILSPNIKRYGVDRSDDQIKFLHESYPGLAADIKNFDATKKFDGSLAKVSVAFTQAVIMHIQTGKSHLVALSNLFQAATDQVVLLEMWGSHNFLKDINSLFRKKLIPWENLYIYYRISSVDPSVRLIVCSRVPLGYDPLVDYKETLEKYGKNLPWLKRLKGWLTSY